MIEIKRVKKVWGRGGHSAFTDLCWFRGAFWLVFREASGHMSEDGIVVVLKSDDGFEWQLAAELAQNAKDLRDPKLVVGPDQRLMMTVAAVMPKSEGGSVQSYIYFSGDGEQWSAPKPVGRVNDWIWRTRFIGEQGYAVSYCYQLESATLYRLNDDDGFDLWCDPLLSKAQHGLGYPNEHDLFPIEGGQMGCLLRRDADSFSAQLGVSHQPFKQWRWYDLDVAIGGPVVLPLADRRFLTVVRLNGPERTSVCELHIDKPRIEEILELPSGGDCSYAGLIERNGSIWCSYYSSHEDKASIYMAELELGVHR